MVVYRLINKVTDRSYIGKTENYEVRLGWHRNAAVRESKTYIHRAIHKYGWDSFTKEIIFTCRSPEILKEAEIFLIDYYNTYGDGYNLTLGGEGTKGLKHTKEHIEKRMLKLRGAKRPGSLLRYNKARAKKHSFRGWEMDLDDWSNMLDIKRSVLYSRRKRNKSGIDLFFPDSRRRVL